MNLGDTVSFVVVPTQGVSGSIYRLRVYEDVKILPSKPGIFCLTAPLTHPGAPIMPVFWGVAVDELNDTVATHPAFPVCRQQGATSIAVLEVSGGIGRRRILRDLMQAHPGFLNEIGETAIASDRRSRNKVQRTRSRGIA